jgi:GT2 family glycosyltransferase
VTESELVSFVVIAYNEADNIARTLASIAALKGLSKYEVIVVDDGSRDNTVQVVTEIAAQNPRVRLVKLPENHGRGYARSRGIAEANGEFIATVDADITLPPDWYSRARAALCGHDAVGGTAIPDGDVAYIYRRFRFVPRFVAHTTSVTGSNALYRREVFGVVKFDPALREGEDVALNQAIKAQGLSTATVPGLLVAHEESKTFSESLKWLFESGGGATRQLITYREVRQPDLATAAFVVALTVGLYFAARGRRVTGTAIPLGFILAASLQHLRSRFETPKSHWRGVAPAVVADCAMLTAYFAGRLVGLKALRPGWLSNAVAWAIEPLPEPRRRAGSR